AALPRLEQRERVGLHGLGIDEPRSKLGKGEQLGRAFRERQVDARAARRGGGWGAMSGPPSSNGKATRAFEDAFPPVERGGGRRSQPRVRRERLGDGAHGA